MTTDPNVEPCTAHIVNEHSAGTHHCTLEAGHTGGQFDGDHAGPVNDKGVRYCWSDRAIGAVPHHSPAAPAGLGVSATPSHTDLRERLRRALGINPPAEETHVVADDSDDPERIDGMRRRAAAAVPAVPTTTKDGAQ